MRPANWTVSKGAQLAAGHAAVVRLKAELERRNDAYEEVNTPERLKLVQHLRRQLFIEVVYETNEGRRAYVAKLRKVIRAYGSPKISFEVQFEDDTVKLIHVYGCLHPVIVQSHVDVGEAPVAAAAAAAPVAAAAAAAAPVAAAVAAKRKAPAAAGAGAGAGDAEDQRPAAKVAKVANTVKVAKTANTAKAAKAANTANTANTAKAANTANTAKAAKAVKEEDGHARHHAGGAGAPTSVPAAAAAVARTIAAAADVPATYPGRRVSASVQFHDIVDAVAGLLHSLQVNATAVDRTNPNGAALRSILLQPQPGEAVDDSDSHFRRFSRSVAEILRRAIADRGVSAAVGKMAVDAVADYVEQFQLSI